MHKVYKPKGFARAPDFCHSVYGVGEQRPRLTGLKDFSQEDNGFTLGEEAIGSVSSVLFNTGKMADNPDLEENLEMGMNPLKFNEYVIYDEAQVRIRYLLHCDFIFNSTN